MHLGTPLKFRNPRRNRSPPAEDGPFYHSRRGAKIAPGRLQDGLRRQRSWHARSTRIANAYCAAQLAPWMDRADWLPAGMRQRTFDEELRIVIHHRTGREGNAVA